MRRLLLSSVALCGLTSGTIAADVPVYEERVAPEIVSIFSWSGLYVGAHGGYGWGETDWTSPDSVPPGFFQGSHDLDGFLAGGQLGVNYQIGAWVLGIEGDFSWTDLQGEHALRSDPRFNLVSEVNWLATVTPRVGYASDRWLLYAKGGVAVTDADYFVRGVADSLFDESASDTRVGWTVGGGLEYAFRNNWSAKFEYSYMDFGSDQLSFTQISSGLSDDTFDIDQHVHAVKIGINYRFGAGN